MLYIILTTKKSSKKDFKIKKDSKFNSKAFIKKIVKKREINIWSLLVCCTKQIYD